MSKTENAISTVGRCGEAIKLPVCANCGNEDLSVERGLCGYCSTVHPERLDTIKCRDCEEFKPYTEFENSEEGIITHPICFECETYWDLLYDATMREERATVSSNCVYLH